MADFGQQIVKPLRAVIEVTAADKIISAEKVTADAAGHSGNRC